ncbi:MAG: hypothetical protein II811_06890 [Spirochaetaceae bacterium]|nr:hypothetical protein [Spirochaetaceae bacterium]
MIETEDFAKLPLYEQLAIKANIANYDIVYIGDNYDYANEESIKKFKDLYGNEESEESSFHISPENMEMAIEQGGEIRWYIGNNFTDQDGEYIALVRKKSTK